MARYIELDTLFAEIERRRDAALMRQQNLESIGQESVINEMVANELNKIISLINTVKVKEVDLLIYTIIAECCDWLALHTRLSHTEIEGFHNSMLTVKDEQLKARKENRI